MKRTFEFFHIIFYCNKKSTLQLLFFLKTLGFSGLVNGSGALLKTKRLYTDRNVNDFNDIHFGVRQFLVAH
jgi:hypothetical protein